MDENFSAIRPEFDVFETTVFQKRDIEEVRKLASTLLNTLENFTPLNTSNEKRNQQAARCLAIARTKLQEFVFFGVRAILESERQ